MGWTWNNTCVLGEATKKAQYDALWDNIQILCARVIDNEETDQGATGNGHTVKAYVDAVGSSKKATLFFPHSGSGDTTAYTFSTSVSVPSNITCVFQPGAIASIGSSATLTINGPFEARPLQVFSGSGHVAFNIRNVWADWFGASKDYATLLNMITKLGAANHYFVHLSPTTWTVDTNLSVTNNFTLVLPSGCLLSPSAGKTLTISGFIHAGIYQIFSQTGTVSLARNCSGYPEWFGAYGNGSADDSGALNKLISALKTVSLRRADYQCNFPVTNTAKAIADLKIVGAGTSESKISQYGSKVLDFSNYNYTTGKTEFMSLADLWFEGDLSGDPICHFGASDFCVFQNVIFQEAGGDGVVFDGNLCTGIKFNGCNFFSNKDWAIRFSVQYIQAVSLHQCRIEGTDSFGQENGILIDCSHSGHSASINNPYSSVLLNQCHFERLTGYSVFVRVGSGVVIKNSSVSYGPIFLSHLASGCTIRSNFFFDSQATVIDSGLFNNCSQNVWGKGAGLQVLTDDHGFNSLIPDADNVNRTGTDGWSITGSVVREHGHKNTGMAAVNPLKCTGGGYAARTLKVSANTFYVLRVGFKTEDNTIATQGGQVTISDAGGTLLSTGALTSDDNACGYIDYQSYAFKTGAYTTITIKIESLNSETIYFLVVDVARNACQENPSLEDTWSGGLPTANWEATNNISVSEYTADYHSGSKCIRIQAPAAVTSASECRVKALGLETGKTYECSFWVKDVTPANGFIYVQFGLGYIASAQYGVGNYGNYVIGISGWQKYTFQFVSNAGDADFVSLARLSPRTWERTLDILVDDITIVHVERDRPRWNRLTTASPSIDVYCDHQVIDSSSNAVNATLGDGRYIGQILMIVMEDSTNSSTVSVAHHETSDPEVGTFATVDETWVLMWTGTEWSTLKASCSF